MSLGDERIALEVHAQHDDLAAWLRDAAADALERLREAHDARFTMVTVAGEVIGLASLLGALGGAGGSVPELAIEVADVEVLVAVDTLVVVRFTEVHHSVAPSSRIATAVLGDEPTARNGLRWVALHETSAATPPIEPRPPSTDSF